MGVHVTGMLLTIYDMGVRQLAIYGPEGLALYMNMLRLFVNRYASAVASSSDLITVSGLWNSTSRQGPFHSSTASSFVPLQCILRSVVLSIASHVALAPSNPTESHLQSTFNPVLLSRRAGSHNPRSSSLSPLHQRAELPHRHS